MNRNALNQLKGIWLIFGSLVFVVLAWYAHFVLRTADTSDAILVSLFFGTCAVLGLISLVKDGRHPRFALDLQRLTKTQKLILATAGFSWGACFLWLASSEKIRVFLRTTFGMGIYWFFKLVFVIGFFASLYIGFRYLLEARRRR